MRALSVSELIVDITDAVYENKAEFTLPEIARIVIILPTQSSPQGRLMWQLICNHANHSICRCGFIFATVDSFA
jgi:hypothetical protein